MYSKITVDEALTKVCPMGLNKLWGKSKCIGPECMAWRWIENTMDSKAPKGFCGLVSANDRYERY